MTIDNFVLPEHHQVIAGRLRLHYLDWGRSDRPPVVFLHGGGLTAHIWDLVCLSLRDRFHCLALDLRGHGDSEWSPNLEYGLAAHAADLAYFLRIVQVRHPYLVGMSVGGLVSMAYAAAHPAALAGLVLIDAAPSMNSAGAARLHSLMVQPAEFDSIEEMIERSLAADPTRDRALQRRSLLQNLHQLPNGKWTWKYDRRHRFSDELNLVPKERELLWAQAGKITCPTLVIRGGSSDVISDEIADRLARSIRKAEWLRVEGAGHRVPTDSPASLIEILRRFL